MIYVNAVIDVHRSHAVLHVHRTLVLLNHRMAVRYVNVQQQEFKQLNIQVLAK